MGVNLKDSTNPMNATAIFYKRLPHQILLRYIALLFHINVREQQPLKPRRLFHYKNDGHGQRVIFS